MSQVKPVKKNESQSAALLAGATAGAIEGFVTYPFEFVKTQSQFARKAGASSKSTSPFTVAKETFNQRGVKGFYVGCNALVAGNAVKAAVRFFSYDQFKTLLADKDVSPVYVSNLLCPLLNRSVIRESSLVRGV
ncbi:hypothetical protein EMMF5_004846 [Cystobasidiomycetes sp. EMM_F5]